jgi:hypothetical protein
MPDAVVLDLKRGQPRPTLATEISDRLSEELVIALVGPIGSGVSTSARYLSEILSQQFQYVVAPIIKPSEIIPAEAHRIGMQNIAKTPNSTYYRPNANCWQQAS